MPPEMAVVPPTQLLFSMSSVASPCLAATVAAVRPPAPAPSTTRSKLSTAALTGLLLRRDHEKRQIDHVRGVNGVFDPRAARAAMRLGPAPLAIDAGASAAGTLE